MGDPQRQFNLLISALLAYATTVVLFSGPRVEAAFGTGVIIGAGVMLQRLDR
jgi:hypothetical protein